MAAGNSSQFLASLCVNALSIQRNHSFLYDVMTLTTCIMNAVLSPFAMAGNALILAAIRNNKSLRTPSYILIGGLAFTDFCTGLFAQPFYAVDRYAEFKGNKKRYCFAYRIANMAGPYFAVITLFTITTMAMERWLHVSNRSLLTVRRTVILFFLFLLLPIPYITMRWLILENPSLLPWSQLLTGFIGLMCFLIMLVAYFKVFRIITLHRRRILDNANRGINLKKYTKSVYTILSILACFALCFFPHMVCVIVVGMVENYTEISASFVHLTATMLYCSSSLNPVLYCWRMKALRESVKGIMKQYYNIGKTC